MVMGAAAPATHEALALAASTSRFRGTRMKSQLVIMSVHGDEANKSLLGQPSRTQRVHLRMRAPDTSPPPPTYITTLRPAEGSGLAPRLGAERMAQP